MVRYFEHSKLFLTYCSNLNFQSYKVIFYIAYNNTSNLHTNKRNNECKSIFLLKT